MRKILRLLSKALLWFGAAVLAILIVLVAINIAWQ